MGIPGMESRTVKSDSTRHGGGRHSGRHRTPGRQLLPRALRPPDRVAAEVSARHGRTRAGAAPDRPDRRHSRRRRHLRSDRPPTTGEQGDGVESAARRDRVHRPALRQLHETTDADARKARSGTPPTIHTAQDPLMNARFTRRTHRS